MGCSCATERPGGPEDNSDQIYLGIISEHLKEYHLLVYSHSTCASSQEVKDLLRKEGLEFEYFDLDKLTEGKKILHALEKLTIYKSPPYIFYNKVYLGGLSECHQFLKTLN